MRIAWFAVVVLLFSVAPPQHAWAEKITVDPNTPGSQPAQVVESPFYRRHRSEGSTK